MINNVRQEFEIHNPKFVYIDHQYVTSYLIGVSFLAISDKGQVGGGVRLYSRDKGKIFWDNPVGTFNSWKDVTPKAIAQYNNRQR